LGFDPFDRPVEVERDEDVTNIKDKRADHSRGIKGTADGFSEQVRLVWGAKSMLFRSQG